MPKARTKFHVIEDKRVALPKGISMENKNGRKQLVVTWKEHKKDKRQYFPYTLQGLADARTLNESKKNEEKKFGADFGTISDDEKRALDLWRTYVKEAMANGFHYASAYEVMKSGLDSRKTTSPDFTTLARLYFDKSLMRKTDGNITDHAETVRTRLFNHICPYFGNRPVHTITEDDILDFLDTRKGLQGKATTTTREQFLGLIKSVFKFAVEQDRIAKEHNPVRKLKPTKKKVASEPEILRVEDVKRIFAFVKNNPQYHKWIPALTIGFFCGPRVEERAKLTYADIFVGGRNEIYISAATAKNGIARFVYPSANVKAWLDFAKAHGVSMEATDSLIQGGDTVKQKRDAHSTFLRTLAAKIGITFPRNCIRHTAASFMAETQGQSVTANQLGHDLSILLQHYRRAITKTEAEEFFNIFPDSV